MIGFLIVSSSGGRQFRLRRTTYYAHPQCYAIISIMYQVHVSQTEAKGPKRRILTTFETTIRHHGRG